jgi:hypothetical protein
MSRVEKATVGRAAALFIAVAKRRLREYPPFKSASTVVEESVMPTIKLALVAM